MADELIFENMTPQPLVFETPTPEQIRFLTDITSQKLYLSWLKLGHEGTEADFLEWLRVKGDAFTFEDFTQEQIQLLTGKTPRIVNGYWWIGEENSGVKATGEDGYTPQFGVDYHNGTDGKSVEFQVSSTHIQWRLVGDVTWINLVALTAITGAIGKSAYQSYVDTTTDNPKLSEAEWSASRNLKYINVDLLRFSMQGALGAWYGATYAALGITLNYTTSQSDIANVTGSQFSMIYRADYKCKVVQVKISTNVASLGFAVVKYTLNLTNESFTNKEIVYLNENVSWADLATITNNIVLNRNDVLMIYYKPSVTATVWGRLFLTLERIFT